MTSRFRRLARLFSCLLMFGMAAYAAEPAKTVVSDTIYRADGSPASGTMMISWPAFVTADGKPVAAGSKTVKIGADGAVNISLVPTQGATPAGTYYKVVLSLDDGASSQEYWTVPTLSPTTIAAIRSSVVPATVAMQVVSREYVDSALANTVRKTGDETVAGVKTFDSSPLVPSPSAPTAAANKDYVDVSVAAGAGSSTLALNHGGTNQTSWTPARCVRVANNGSSLEAAPADCGIATNSDMLDGLHAASFQAAMANAATLSKVTESGGNPLWNGSAWPGGGGSGNATQIQGKAVDTPDSARQFEVYDGATAFKKWQDPVVRMNRDCGIVGSGDETAALNTCIANLPNYTGVLQCDKPGMIIHSTGVVIRDKIGIRIETAGGGHTLNNACQIIYTGADGGTVIDVERTRDSVIFKGFNIYAGAADIGIQTGQTGSGGNIATSDSFEELTINNNNGRSTFIGFMIGDSTNQNSDEMRFRNVSVYSQNCTKCGTAFKSVISNVYGAEFHGINLSGLAIGWDWTNNAKVDKVGGYTIALLYKLQGNNAYFHVQHEDVEFADQILSASNGSLPLIEENGRVILNTPTYGGVTGTSGHPAWDNSSGGSLRVRNMQLGSTAGLTLLKGSISSRADVDFYDPGIVTYGYGNGAILNPNSLNALINNGFLSGVAGTTIWTGRGFLDEKGMTVPGVGMQLTSTGSGGSSRLRTDFSPCIRGNLCLGEGQIELTGVHSVFNVPTISYTGTAGSTTRIYAVVACSDTACAAGNRSIPSYSLQKNNTQATLDGSNYITLSWTPALGVNKYGILQYGGSETWNLLMSNISCATNPCTVNVTTDSGSYASGYPAYNETSGVTLRGAIKFGKSATQTAPVDFTYASLVGFPTLNQNTTGTAAGLTAQYTDWSAGSGGASIKNKPTLAASKTCTGTDKVSSFDASTGLFACTADQTGGAGGGITSLNGATAATQTFVDGANIHVSTDTGTGAHTIAVTGLGDAAAKNTGTTAGTVAAGDDSRLSDARTPTAHASTHVTGGGDVIPDVASGGNSGLMNGVDKAKLDTLAAPPTVGFMDKTADYTAGAADGGEFFRMNCASCTFTLPAAPPSNYWAVRVMDINASDLTVSPNGVTLNNPDGSSGTSNLTLGQGKSFLITTDGTTYSRTEILGGAAYRNIGTTAGSVMAGDDSRVTGLGTAATHAATDFLAAADFTRSNVVGLWTTCTGYLKSDGTCDTPGGAGTVTHTGNLTSNAVVIGNGTADEKVDTGCSTNGTGTMTCTGFSGPLSGNVTGSASGTAAGLAAQYIDWSASSGGASIANKPTLGDAAAKNTGTTAGTVAAGDDSRMTNARTPTAHASTHQNGGSDEIATATAAANAIPKAGAGGTLGTAWIPDLSATYLPLHSTADLAAGLSAQYTDWTAGSGGASIKNKPTLGDAAAKNTGTTTGTVAAGDDSRFTNARTPTAHASTHQNGGSDEIATASAGANAIPKAGAGGQLAAGWMPALTGDVTTSAGAVATTLRTGLNVKLCEIHIWGTGGSSVLQNADDEAASCLNKYGVTWTFTYIGCWANAGSPTVMITKTGGNNALTGNLTCGTASWASGTLASGADKTTADGGTVDVNVVSAGGVATNIRVVIAGTI